jgi:AmmeMemoRadiSam system protein B
LTKKDFDTPLGTVATDREMVERIAALADGQPNKKKGSLDFFVDEFVHRNEHSIEFQVLFLQYLFGGRENFKIVPILCTAFHRHGSGTAASSEIENEVDQFVTALSRTISEKGDVCCIAGVDLSHIGRRFGQDVSLSPELIAGAETEDREMLDHVLKADSEGFIEFIRKEKDRRNVCGVPAIYSLLKVLKPGSSALLSYGRAEEPDTDSLVTFAGAAFYTD